MTLIAKKVKVDQVFAMLDAQQTWYRKGPLQLQVGKR